MTVKLPYCHLHRYTTVRVHWNFCALLFKEKNRTNFRSKQWAAPEQR